MTAPLHQLRQLTTAVQPLSEDDWRAFAAIWSPFAAKRKELLTAPGTKENYLYFVLEGIQRVYYFDDHDREATLVFSYAPSFGGVLDSLMLQMPGRYGYEALSASAFLRTSYRELETVMHERRDVETFVRKGLAGALAGVLERLVELQCFSAEDRFRRLLQRSPHILQLIPHKYLANYLGIDPTNFSKLLNRVRI